MKISRNKINIGQIRTGIGFDIHKFSDNKQKKLYLGGVKFEFRGLEGASRDADVVLHAIADSLLGASSLPDIGSIFPSDKCKGISSKKILRSVKRLLDSKSVRIEFIDCVIIAQEPKLGKSIEKMRSNIAKILIVEKEKISIKAKSPEGVGSLGKGEGISAIAVSTVKL